MTVFYTSAGEAKIADIIDGTVAVPTYYTAQGTGAGTHSKASTTLNTEASEARVSTTQSQPAADTNQFQGTINADGTKTITNAGLFDASTGGNLILVADGLSIGVDNGDSIQYTWQLEQA